MAFPLSLRDVVVELYINGDWVDITSDVREDSRITIARGAPDEAGQIQPMTCSLVLKDPTHKYAKDNPNGIYYGHLNRNIPIRVGINTATDNFNRTSVDDMGVADTGQEWFMTWGSSGAFSNFDVSGGNATMAVGAANRHLAAYLPDIVSRDVEVYATVTPPYADVLGGPITVGIYIRAIDTDDLYFADLWISSAEVTYVRLFIIEAGVFTAIGDPVQVTHFTYTGQKMALRAQIVGDTFLFKVWDDAVAEPFEWHIGGVAFDTPAPGFVGIRSDVYTGNTNVMPAVFTWHEFIVRSPRFIGEVSKLPQSWDVSGNDITIPIVAASVLRRLSQGDPPVQSTLYRGIAGLTTPPVAYWPGEDGADAAYLSSGITGKPPMTAVGTVDFAAYSSIASSRPIPQVNGGSLEGQVSSYTSTGNVQLRYLMHIPSDFPAHTWISGLQCTNGQSWDLKYQPDGGLSFDLWVNAILIFTTGWITFEVLDKDVMVSIELEQDGSGIDWAFRTLEVGASSGFSYTGTTASRTLGRPVRLLLDPAAALTGTAFGHINIRKEVTSLFDLDDELDGYAGESAVDRMLRLSEQNGVDIFFNNAESDSALVGPQRALGSLALIQEAADADRGMLGDARSDPSLLYIERARLYSQTPVVTLDYSAGQLAPGFAPTDDDRFTRNYITVNRLNGGYATAIQETGPMSILPSDQGGVGLYQGGDLTINVYSDDQLPDVAGWELNKGTANASRYPHMTVNLHNAAVAADTELSLGMLDLDFGDRLDITNPKQGRAYDDIRQVLFGYREIIGGREHTFDLVTGPAEPYDISVLDNASSRLDTSGSDLTNSITTTATSFQVDTPSGALWSTRAADLPLPLTVGGEEISVGAVSGTTSPQTFSSVTRSVNGVVKAHAAGAAVSLAPGYVRRLGL